MKLGCVHEIKPQSPVTIAPTMTNHAVSTKIFVKYYTIQQIFVLNKSCFISSMDFDDKHPMPMSELEKIFQACITN